MQLTIPGITQGALDTGSGNYFGGCLLTVCSAETATFSGTIALVNNGTSTTVTITVGTVTGSPAASSGKLVFLPATTITDGGGNGASGSFSTASNFHLF